MSCFTPERAISADRHFSAVRAFHHDIGGVGVDFRFLGVRKELKFQAPFFCQRKAVYDPFIIRTEPQDAAQKGLVGAVAVKGLGEAAGRIFQCCRYCITAPRGL